MEKTTLSQSQSNAQSANPHVPTIIKAYTFAAAMISAISTRFIRQYIVLSARSIHYALHSALGGKVGGVRPVELIGRYVADSRVASKKLVVRCSKTGDETVVAIDLKRWHITFDGRSVSSISKLRAGS
jgi:hypothetical protein